MGQGEKKWQPQVHYNLKPNAFYYNKSVHKPRHQRWQILLFRGAYKNYENNRKAKGHQHPTRKSLQIIQLGRI